MAMIYNATANNGSEVILWMDVNDDYVVTTREPGNPYRRERCISDDFTKAEEEFLSLLQ